MKFSQVFRTSALLAISALLAMAPAMAALEVTPARDGVGAGGGGHEVGQEAAAFLFQVVEDFKALGSKRLKGLDIAAFERKAQQAMIVAVTEDIIVKGESFEQPSTGFSMLGGPTPLIKVIIGRWNSLKTEISKKALMAHEVLVLMRLESTGKYPISGEYQRILMAIPANGKLVAIELSDLLAKADPCLYGFADGSEVANMNFLYFQSCFSKKYKLAPKFEGATWNSLKKQALPLFLYDLTANGNLEKRGEFARLLDKYVIVGEAN